VRGVDQGCSIQPSLIGIKDEEAVIAERAFFGLPGGFVALVGGPTGVTAPSYNFIVIGGEWRCTSEESEGCLQGPILKSDSIKLTI
jgi:hypothetical protein